MKKGVKLAAIILGVLLIVGILFGVLANRYGPRRLLAFAKERIHLASNGRYELQLDTLDFNVFTFSVYLGDLRFQRDTSVDAFSGIPLLDEHDVSIQFENLSVDYFNLLRYVLRNEIKIDYFELVHPQVEIRQNPEYHPSAQVQDTAAIDSTLFQDFADTTVSLIPTLLIDRFKLQDASFAFFEANRSFPLLNISGFSTSLDGLSKRAETPVQFKAMDLSLDTLTAWVSYYTAKVEVLGWKTADDQMVIDSICYGHVVSPQRLNELKGFRASKLNVQARNLVLQGIDFDRLVEDTSVVIRRIDIDMVNFLLEKDQNEERISPTYKALPTESLMAGTQLFRIDTIEIQEGVVRVAMQAPDAKLPGRLFLNRVHALITNVTNHGPSLAENSVMQARARAYLMGKGLVELDYRFPLDSKTHAFYVNGSLGPMSITEINSFVSALAFVRFSSGDIKGMTFQFSGNESHTEGTLNLEYENLKLARFKDFQAVLDKNPRNGLLVGLANLVIPNHHLSTKKSYKPGEIYWEREYNRDIVHYSIQSVVSGVISNLGLGPKNPEKAFARKKRREAKRAERKVRKEEKQEKKDLKRAKRQERKAARRNKKD